MTGLYLMRLVVRQAGPFDAGGLPEQCSSSGRSRAVGSRGAVQGDNATRLYASRADSKIRPLPPHEVGVSLSRARARE